MVVDCGARDAELDPALVIAFSQGQLIGFELDDQECQRLNRIHPQRHAFHSTAVGRQEGTRTLYVTHNPACSSLFEPNQEFLGPFLESTSLKVERIDQVNTVDLDSYLARVGVTQIDFLQLDVQGAELDVLHGCPSLLQTGVLGVRVEVEFSPMYRSQPLFGDVDAYLRSFGFTLFDLSRVRYRRSALPPGIPTRGQLLWGDALYLRDYRYFVERSMRLETLKLAVLASAYRFHDYSAEIVQFLLDDATGMLDSWERSELERALFCYLRDLEHVHPATRVVRAIARRHFHRWIEDRIPQEVLAGRRAGETHWAD